MAKISIATLLFSWTVFIFISTFLYVPEHAKTCTTSRPLFTYSPFLCLSLFALSQSISIAAICWSIVINCTNAYIGARLNQSAPACPVPATPTTSLAGHLSIILTRQNASMELMEAHGACQAMEAPARFGSKFIQCVSYIYIYRYMYIESFWNVQIPFALKWLNVTLFHAVLSRLSALFVSFFWRSLLFLLTSEPPAFVTLSISQMCVCVWVYRFVFRPALGISFCQSAAHPLPPPTRLSHDLENSLSIIWQFHWPRWQWDLLRFI